MVLVVGVVGRRRQWGRWGTANPAAGWRRFGSVSCRELGNMRTAKKIRHVI